VKKIIGLINALICGVLITFMAQAQGFLKAQGKIIVNEKGEKIILRGMGLGGWMLQEGYMFKLSNIGQQYRIKDKIEALVGPQKTEAFYQQWLLNHTRKIDIDSMAAWGFNSVRLPMHYNLYTLPIEQEPVAGQNTWLDKGFAMTDSLLAWCKANKMYLILDLHAAPGGQGNDLPIADRDPAKPSLWESQANQEKTIALWRKLAERYANEPWVAGYDIINEPNWGFENPTKDFRGTEENKNEPLRKLMVAITRAIREVDQQHIIIIEGNGFGNNYRGIMPPWDNNMVLSFHKYGNFNTLEAIKGFLAIQDQYNVPLWLGESGENSNNWFTEAIALVENKNIGWAWWQLKKMGINNPLEIKIMPSYQKLLDFWNKKAPQPTSQETQQALDELIELLKLENNIYHKDVIDAMFRQVTEKKAKPFKNHFIQQPSTVIDAIDFDLGGQRIGYYDKDTASYQYTPGVNTQGNRGRAYRNDGVDIQYNKASNRYHVFSIETDEWLNYTVNVAKAGNYQISVEVASEKTEGAIELSLDGKPLPSWLGTPATGSDDTWQKVSFGKVKLKKGLQQIRIKAAKGGFLLRTIQFNI
jgi:aryl-phospho-beta-D-glucosidase BglC (GH1 family)